MGETMKKLTAKVDGKGDGLDRQAATNVTKRWLSTRPAPQAVSMESVYTQGLGENMFGMPCVVCPACSQVMIGRLRGRKRRECAECYRIRVRQADRERQAKTRRGK